MLRLSGPFLRGDDVRELQARLNALGFAAGKHDGILGGQTVAALRDFQRNLAIAEDGIVGAETIAALERLRMVTRRGLGPRIREREARRARPPGLKGKRIAIDPGHGGDDPGARGAGGLAEADVAFALAARVARLLSEAAAEVILTRGPYEGPDEQERARRANEAESDLLLSLHAGADIPSGGSGVATYFFEHDRVASEPGEHLARALQAALTQIGRRPGPSLGRAYPILRETRMPAVVLEPFSVASPGESGLLDDPSFLEELAAGIVGGVRDYFSAEPSS